VRTLANLAGVVTGAYEHDAFGNLLAHELLGAFWRSFLRYLTRVWDSIPTLQASGTLQTPYVCA
jgi:hypothetical protein